MAATNTEIPKNRKEWEPLALKWFQRDRLKAIYHQLGIMGRKEYLSFDEMLNHVEDSLSDTTGLGGSSNDSANVDNSARQSQGQ